MAPSFSIELGEGERERLLAIARASVRAGRARREPTLPAMAADESALMRPCASFVSLSQAGRLRGCIGSLEPVHPLAESVAVNAYGAAYRDPRFPPLSEPEIGETRVEIAVLSPLSPLAAGSELELLAQLEPAQDGLLIVAGERRATFLPKVWEQLAEPAQFLRHLKAKAGLPEDFWPRGIRCFRYRTVDFAEPVPAARAS